MNAAYKTGKVIISGLGIALLLSLVFMNFFSRSYMPISAKECVEYQHVGILFIICFVIIFALFMIALRKNFLRYISPEIIAAISALLYLALGLILIFHVEPPIRSDTKLCFEAAIGFMNGDYSSLEKGGYLYENSHQIGFVLYDYLLAHISQDTRFLFFINLILTIVNNLLIVRLTSIMTDGSEEAIVTASFLSMLFLPHLNFILFAYNQTISLTLILYSAVKLSWFLRKHSIPALVQMIVSSFLAVCMRGNATIFVISEIIILLLHFIRRKAAAQKDEKQQMSDGSYEESNRTAAPRRNRLCIVAAVLLLGAALAAGPAMRTAGHHVTGHSMPKELPKILWVAMGMQDGPRASGWYNGYLYRTYRETDYNMALTVERAHQEISGRIQVFMGNPGLMLFFYEQKILSMWGEPTYESIWIGPLEEMDQHMNGRFLHSLYTGGPPYSAFCNYCAVIYLLILIGAAIGMFVMLTGLVRRRTRNRNKIIRRGKVLSPASLDLLLFPVLYLLGGFIFHIMIWEAKSQYVMIYIYMLIPLASFGYAFICPKTFLPKQEG